MCLIFLGVRLYFMLQNYAFGGGVGGGRGVHVAEASWTLQMMMSQLLNQSIPSIN